jgi:hypothetical protein
VATFQCHCLLFRDKQKFAVAPDNQRIAQQNGKLKAEAFLENESSVSENFMLERRFFVCACQLMCNLAVLYLFE